jgi:hypothetical protein
MAKTVIQNEVDPCIAIVLVEVPEGVPGVARGTHGVCTQCGWPLHRWDFRRAVADARIHVDMHEPVTIGGDRDSLVR